MLVETFPESWIVFAHMRILNVDVVFRIILKILFYAYVCLINMTPLLIISLKDRTYCLRQMVIGQGWNCISPGLEVTLIDQVF